MHLLKLLLIAFLSCGLSAERGEVVEINTGEHGETLVTYETKKGELYEFVYNSHKVHKSMTIITDGNKNVITWGISR